MKIQFDMAFNQLTPVYMQIVDYFKAKIVAGKIADGDELPSRRELAINLTINPNTVQKAYSILQDEGLIATNNTSKSVAVVNMTTRQKIMLELSKDVFGRFVGDVKALGLDIQNVIELIKERWGND